MKANKRVWVTGIDGMVVEHLGGGLLHVGEADLLALVRRVKEVRSDGASNGVVVGDGLGVARDDEGVGAAAADLGNGNLAVLDGGELGGEGVEEGDLLAVLDAVTRDLDGSSGLEDGLADLESGEGLDGEGGVGLGAALDEGSGKRVDLRERAGGRVEGVGSRVVESGRRLSPAGVAGLGREDRAGSREVL